MFPLLALLFERCELATQSSDPQSSDAFNLDIQAFVQHQERDRKPFLANEPEIDGLVISVTINNTNLFILLHQAKKILKQIEILLPALLAEVMNIT